MTPSSSDVFLPMTNLHLIFVIIKSNHLNRIVTENGQFVAENSFNIIRGRNQDEGTLCGIPFEE